MKHQPLLLKQAKSELVTAGFNLVDAETAVQALAEADMLVWPAEADKSRLPYGLTVRPTAMGVEVDAYLVVRALFKALASESVEDPDGIVEELAVIDGASGPGLDAVLDELIERLGGAEVRYPTKKATHRLIDMLVRAAGPALPAQREREAS